MKRRGWCTAIALGFALLSGACDRNAGTAPSKTTAKEAPAAVATPDPATAQSAVAAPTTFAALVSGVDYEIIDPAPPAAASDGPINVIEAFSYACSHCANFEPQLAAWRAALPSDVRFEAVPMPLSDVWTEFARAYYAASDLGLLERTHAELLESLHTKGAKIDSTDSLVQWYVDNAEADAGAFRAAMTSPGTDARIEGARSRAQAWGVSSTPTLIIDDRYRVMGFTDADGGFARTLAVADLILGEVRKARTPPA